MKLGYFDFKSFGILSANCGFRTPAPHTTNGVSVFAVSPSPWLPVTSISTNMTTDDRAVTFIAHSVIGSEHIARSIVIEELLNDGGYFLNAAIDGGDLLQIGLRIGS